MSRRKATVQPRRTKGQAAAKLAEALLENVQGDLGDVGSFLFVCIVALRVNGGDDVRPDVATVLEVAFDKLVLDVNRNLRDALDALGQGGGK